MCGTASRDRPVPPVCPHSVARFSLVLVDVAERDAGPSSGLLVPSRVADEHGVRRVRVEPAERFEQRRGIGLSSRDAVATDDGVDVGGESVDVERGPTGVLGVQ
jgi:hypothetical protein